VYGGSMIGNHGYEVILDGYVKGIVSNDLATVAYEAMKEEVATLSYKNHRNGYLIFSDDHLGYQD
jgi:hypothetical protein